MTIREWWSKNFGDYAQRERAALPDGTRVRLACRDGTCSFPDHSGVWLTSWTPRRSGDIDDPDDYRLTRESDGEVTYATRAAIEVVDG